MKGKWLGVTVAALLILATIPIVRSTEPAEPVRIWLFHHGGAWLLDKNWKRWRERREQEQALMRPAPKLPIRPEDYRRLPRQGFGFIVDYGRRFRVDSFQGTLTTAVRSGRDTTIALPFTEAEMDSIYREMIALRVFDIEEPYPSFIAEQETPGGPGFHSPGGTKRIEVRAGSAWKHFYVYYPPYTGRTLRASDNWKRLNQWTYLIEQLALRKPEYWALPLPPPYL